MVSGPAARDAERCCAAPTTERHVASDRARAMAANDFFMAKAVYRCGAVHGVPPSEHINPTFRRCAVRVEKRADLPGGSEICLIECPHHLNVFFLPRGRGTYLMRPPTTRSQRRTAR